MTAAVSPTSTTRTRSGGGWFPELLGTFFLVLAAADGGMMGQAFPGVISHTAAVTARR
jgi:hypothetical protein